MHEDVINHCVPAGSKEGKKRTGFAVLLLSVEKGSSKTLDQGCNSFRCVWFFLQCASISHHFALDVLWPLLNMFSFVIQVFVLISRIRTRAGFLPRGFVPTSLMEQVGLYDLNSAPVLAWRWDRRERESESQRTRFTAPSSDFKTF